MAVVTQSIQTEADALREIVTWSKERPLWQRDALRRLVITGELTADDVGKLVALCKDPTLEAEPIEERHITAQKSGAPTISLKSIRNVQNINALTQGQALTFIPRGVTIVYGDNGAGKSGYVRILKRACRARAVQGKEDPILHNIYDAAPKGSQCAEIEYQAGAQSQTCDWKNGEKSDDLLSEVSVFDSRTANVHVDETNDLAYTPFPMKLLEELVTACQLVKSSIESETSKLKSQTPKSIESPKCAPDTQVGIFLNSLSASSSSERLEELIFLNDDETITLADLAADLAHDPKYAARRLKAQRTRLQAIVDAVSLLESSIGKVAESKLLRLTKDAGAKSVAAKLAAEQFAISEPLDGVGSDVWLNLWQAARAYSVREAYLDMDFPVTDAESRCVLCHQELDQDAALRLRRFEAFVQDETQTQALAARQALAEFRQELGKAKISSASLLEYRRFLRDELGNEALADAVRGFVLHAVVRLRAMLRATADLPSEPVSITQILGASIGDLGKREEALLSNEDSEERKEMKAALAELKDREWLCGIKDDVLAEISRKKAIAALHEALKDTRANAITLKNTALSQALITDRLRVSFTQEIDHLHLGGLAIELMQASSQRGISRFRIALMNSKERNAGEILSEGEYRCVALAGFLAELATNMSDSGLIFDDPVSSLDHLHRESIAKRLAVEGRKRQIIVFTHDLPFLFMLRSACTQVDAPALKTEVALRHIQKRQNIPGHCRNEAPEKAQDATTRLSKMRTHLANTRRHYDDDPDGLDWLVSARGLLDSLRQSWESAVEDAISPVLRTFSSKINTVGFAKLSAITEADAITMRRHYGQCSEYLHKISDQVNPAAPTPEIIVAELDALDAWLQDILPRQKKVKVY